VAVANRKAPASSSMSSVHSAHVLPVASAAQAAIAINPPPTSIVLDPVVNGVPESISVEPKLLPVMLPTLAPVTVYTAI